VNSFSNDLQVIPSQVKRRGRPPRAVNLDSFINDIYLPHISKRKLSWQVDQRVIRRYLSPAFGLRKPNDISSREIDDWLYALSKQGLALSTCNRILWVVKSVFTMALRHDVIQQNPCAGIRAFALEKQPERRLSPEEARRLMEALRSSSRPEAAAIRLLMLTGARKSEIVNARWEYFHEEQRLLEVTRAGKNRSIPLSDEAMSVILSLERHTGCPWLFPGQTLDKPISGLFYYWNILRQELGLEKLRIQDLRHSFASFLVTSGCSLLEMQKILGHSVTRTLTRYVSTN